jgi:guanylate kinase
MTQSGVPSSQEDIRKNSAGQYAGRLFIVSAPSGAGKTTLCKALCSHFHQLCYSISYTTREVRKGEQQAVDYYFISKEKFEQGIRQNRWAEWAKVHGNYYGTCARWITQSLKAGQHILLDIDVQGMRQLSSQFPEAVTIFIMPPSIEELQSRLKQRGLDDASTIALRMKNAQTEMGQQGQYRHVVINDDLAKAQQQLTSIIECYLKK